MISSAPSYPQPEIPSTASQPRPEEIPSPHSIHSVRGRTSAEPARRTQTPDAILTPPTPVLLSTPLPDVTTLFNGRADSSILNRRPRKRRATTQEVVPADSPSVIALGMSPFMPGQDAMFNQNRLVRNEVILARHLSNLERSYTQSTSSHARSTEDIYRILTDHKTTLDKLAKAVENSTALHSDKEFTALSDSHMKTREAVKAVIRHIVRFSASTAALVSELNDAIRGILPEFLVSTAPDSLSQIHMPTLTSESTPTGTRLESGINPRNFSNLEDRFIRGTKRRRQDVHPDFSPRLGFSRAESHLIHTEAYHGRSDLLNRPREVVYGPISDHLNPEEIVKEAVRKAGMSPITVQSVHPTPRTPGFFSIQFLKDQDAQKFVDLVGVGPSLGGHLLRRAYFVDGSSTGGTSNAVSDSRSRSIEKPWLL